MESNTTPNNTPPRKSYKVWHLLLTVFGMGLAIRVGLGAVPLPEQPEHANYYVPAPAMEYEVLPVNAETQAEPGEPNAADQRKTDSTLASLPE